MSVDPACPQSLRGPEASNSRESSPMPEIYGPEENYVSLQMASAETHDMETVSPLPSFSMDLLIQDSPDSSTSPRVKLLATAADKSTEKKEEKVKTWFQNQRMKCKRWQKNNWPRNSNIVTQGPATTEYPGFYSYHQGCLVNSSGNLPMWGNQTWNNPTWSNQSWNSQSWNNQSWNSQTWCPQAWNNQTWNNQFNNYVEEFLQPQIQYQQNSPVSDLEATLETAGESYNIIQQTAKYFNSQQQIMDLFPNYSLNIQPEDL
ncbi:hypothetical protein EI555_018097 [Monodon monoceros]|uniref:Homeobox domain-containing protein n=1 Tax=Monodon monoceros TaxID=40151 RepID=A0A4U1FPH2_MONMO|nr:hypothetical protein EI555_018097 [Monodon monoceros]